MRDSVTIGRVAGITVGINWSWLIVFALIAWTLATGIFPETNPGLADGAYIAMALVAAVLFFTSLLLHEFGHAFQARREGMEIEGITLWLFGGVAKFSGMFPSAAAEFRIAIAGPLVSLLLGVGFLLLPALLPFAAYVDGVLFWLGSINLALLVFNLLPAFPSTAAVSCGRSSGRRRATSSRRRTSRPRSAAGSATSSSRSASCS